MADEKKVATKEVPKKEATKKQNPNDSLDLSGFDYDNLNGESFEKYLELVNSLSVHENRDFVQHMATGVFDKVLDKNAAEPRYMDVLVGIKINNTKPVNITRIPVGMARNLNAQIMDKNNPASNSRYFLLKKPD